MPGPKGSPVPAKRMGPEARLQHNVMQAILKRRLVFHHCTNARFCTDGGIAGLPDLIILGQSGCLFRELKSEFGNTTADQDEWGWRLHRAGLDYAIWRPEDWTSGKIEKELDEIK